MTNQVFLDVGIQPPTLNNIPFGSIVNVVCGGTGFSLGDTLWLLPNGSTATSYATLDAGDCETYTATVPGSVVATNAGAGLQSRIHGVLLQDLAAGEAGFAMIRGLCMANVVSIDATIGIDAALYCGDDDTDTYQHRLANFIDVVAADNARIIALSRWSGTAIAADAETLIPVLFNGVEGFGAYEGT